MAIMPFHHAPHHALAALGQFDAFFGRQVPGNIDNGTLQGRRQVHAALALGGKGVFQGLFINGFFCQQGNTAAVAFMEGAHFFTNGRPP